MGWVGWHHGLDGHEFEQTLGDGEGQGSLASCSPWGHKESDTTLATEEQPFITKFGASSVAQSVKNLPAMQETACYAGNVGSIPGSGRSPGEGNGNPLQYSCRRNPKDRGAWWATVRGVAKSRT